MNSLSSKLPRKVTTRSVAARDPIGTHAIARAAPSSHVLYWGFRQHARDALPSTDAHLDTERRQCPQPGRTQRARFDREASLRGRHAGADPFQRRKAAQLRAREEAAAKRAEFEALVEAERAAKLAAAEEYAAQGFSVVLKKDEPEPVPEPQAVAGTETAWRQLGEAHLGRRRDTGPHL